MYWGVCGRECGVEGLEEVLLPDSSDDARFSRSRC